MTDKRKKRIKAVAEKLGCGHRGAANVLASTVPVERAPWLDPIVEAAILSPEGERVPDLEVCAPLTDDVLTEIFRHYETRGYLIERLIFSAADFSDIRYRTVSSWGCPVDVVTAREQHKGLRGYLWNAALYLDKALVPGHLCVHAVKQGQDQTAHGFVRVTGRRSYDTVSTALTDQDRAVLSRCGVSLRDVHKVELDLHPEPDQWLDGLVHLFGLAERFGTVSQLILNPAENGYLRRFVSIYDVDTRATEWGAGHMGAVWGADVWCHANTPRGLIYAVTEDDPAAGTAVAFLRLAGA